MRITDNMRTIGLVRAQAAAQRMVQTRSRAVVEGARVTTPSDDRVAYGTIVARSASLSAARVRSRVARDASDNLSIAERALDTSATLMGDALVVATQSANESFSSRDRVAFASSIRAIREQLLEAANTRGTSGYLFGGTKTDAPPFTATGAFVGNDGAIRAPIGAVAAPRVNASGASAFTAAGGRDVMADLDALATALENDDLTTVRSSLDILRADQDQIVRAQVDCGLGIERLQGAADVLDTASLSLSSALGRAAGSDDLAGLATDFSAATSAYERSLEATRRLLALPSLAGG